MKSPRPPNRRSLWWLALTCGSALGTACTATPAKEGGDTGKPKPPAAVAARVEVATLHPSDANLHLRLPGEVEGSRDAVLAAALGGYIEAVSVKVGDSVKKGQVLARVDTATHLARLAQAKVELEAAERELKRAEALGDAIPSADRDTASSRAQAALAQIKTLQLAADRSLILAPFSGTVAQVKVEQGEVATPGAPLVRVVQLKPIKVTVSVPGRDVVALKKGMIARVHADALGGVVEGEVSRIEPAADLKTRSFIVEVDVPNPDLKLLPGMIATVEIESQVTVKRLVILQDFLVTGVKQVGVFLNQGNIARFAEVKLGKIVQNQVVIEDGLKAGQSIVITGHRELADGDPLVISRSGSCCENGRVVFE